MKNTTSSHPGGLGASGWSWGLKKENVYKVQSGVDSAVFVFSFSEKAKSGKYQGFVRLANHKLDRFGNQSLEKTVKVNIANKIIANGFHCLS